MFNGIVLVEDIGEGEEAMEIAEKYGATGGTILRGRGVAAQKENIRNLFNLDIEPEKDILLLITPKDVTDQVIDGLVTELKLEKENAGILFSFDLAATKGLVK